MNEKIPFLDLVSVHEELKEELCEVFKTALSTGCFVGGPMVEGFEQDFARFCGFEHCVGVSSGTDALRFALMAAGVKEGDIVITVPNTFIATAEAIMQAGARPAFVDIDEHTYNMDPEKLREYMEVQCRLDGDTGHPVEIKSGRPVTAVVPVHLYGQMADMDTIQEIADKCGLVVIEDACQAHGAEYFSRKANAWKKAGSMGRAAAFSFYPGKNLGACGEGGAVTTGDFEIAQEIRMLRDHGQAKKYYHEIEGYNGRLDAIQAGILQVKLRHLAERNEQRRACARCYQGLFSATLQTFQVPSEPTWAKAVYHLYVIRTANRDHLQGHLASMNIGTGIHYPIPLHLQNAYTKLGYTRGDLPVAERVASEILSLPMYPGLRPSQQNAVVDCLLGFVSPLSTLRHTPHALCPSA